jgi:hypothetical protein
MVGQFREGNPVGSMEEHSFHHPPIRPQHRKHPRKRQVWRSKTVSNGMLYYKSSRKIKVVRKVEELIELEDLLQASGGAKHLPLGTI